MRKQKVRGKEGSKGEREKGTDMKKGKSKLHNASLKISRVKKGADNCARY